MKLKFPIIICCLFIITQTNAQFITSLNGITGIAFPDQLFATGTAGTNFTITSASDTHTFNLPDAGTGSRGLVTTGSQTFGGNKTFNDKLFINSGTAAVPYFGFSAAPSTGLSYSTSGGGAVEYMRYSFTGTERMEFTSQGKFNLSNDGEILNQLDINISHDATIEVQDGGVAVSTYGGTSAPYHTTTFGGRSASGSSATPAQTKDDQAMAEFIGKGWNTTDGFEHTNRGVFGVYAAENHVYDDQAAYCGIQTTRFGPYSPTGHANDHFSMIIDPNGNAGLTYSETGGFNTSLPSGWAGDVDSRFFSIESSATGSDAGLLIQNGTTTAGGGLKGINIWLDNSTDITYFDNIKDATAPYMLFRVKTLGTPVNQISVTSTGIGMGQNASVLAAPVSQLQIDKGTASMSDIRWTAGSTTGITSGDGFTVGINTSGEAELNQKEALNMNMYTSGSLHLRIVGTGELISGGTGNPGYRQTNGGGTILGHMVIDPASSISSGFGWVFDINNGFLCTQANGTRRIEGMAIKPISVSAGATTEAMSMTFWTQTGGNVVTEKMRITDLGKVGIGVITPTAYLHLIGSASGVANTAPLKFSTGTNLTSAESGTQEYNNSFYQTKNSGLRYGIGGVIFENYSDAGNAATTGISDLYVYSCPANTLASNGEKIEAHYAGTYEAGAGTRTIFIEFAGVNLFNTGALPAPSGSTTWDIQVTIIRKSSSTARAVVTATTPAMSTINWVTFTDEFTLTGLDFTISNNLKLRAQPGVATANLIVAKLSTASWSPSSNN